MVGSFGPPLRVLWLNGTVDCPLKRVFVGACTLTVLKVGNSAELWEFVSRVTTRNIFRGVGVE